MTRRVTTKMLLLLAIICTALYSSILLIGSTPASAQPRSTDLLSPSAGYIMASMPTAKDNFVAVAYGDISTARYESDVSWTIEYLGDLLPQNANPAWSFEHLKQPGYVSTDGNTLTIRTTDAGDRTEVTFAMRGIVSRSTGVTVECRMKVGYIGTDGSIPDTILAITDSTQWFALAFLEDRIVECFNDGSTSPSNYYLINTKSDFHTYRITSKDGITKAYVDGVYVFTLTGSSYSTNGVMFGDGRGNYGGRNGESYWDYVKINTDGVTSGVVAQPPSLTLNTPEINGLTIRVNGVTLPGTSGTTITRIQWDWGDGYSEDHWFPASHTYSRPGTYDVAVTAHQSDGLSTTKSAKIIANVISRAYPTVTLNPSSQSGIAGTTLTYTIIVTNNDPSSFGPSTFSLTYRTTEGWSVSHSPTSLTISPGGSGSFVLSVTSPSTASEGGYSIPIVVRNTGATDYQKWESMVYNVTISYTHLLWVVVVAAVILTSTVVMARKRTKRREKMKQERQRLEAMKQEILERIGEVVREDYFSD